MTYQLPRFKVTNAHIAQDVFHYAVDENEPTGIVSVGYHFDVLPEYESGMPDTVKLLRLSDPCTAEDVADALAMTKTLWDSGTEIWFHCEFGQSRSPAFAFVMLTSYLGAHAMKAAYEATHISRHIREAGKVAYNNTYMAGAIGHLPAGPVKTALKPFAVYGEEGAVAQLRWPGLRYTPR